MASSGENDASKSTETESPPRATVVALILVCASDEPPLGRNRQRGVVANGHQLSLACDS